MGNIRLTTRDTSIDENVRGMVDYNVATDDLPAEISQGDAQAACNTARRLVRDHRLAADDTTADRYLTEHNFFIKIDQELGVPERTYASVLRYSQTGNWPAATVVPPAAAPQPVAPPQAEASPPEGRAPAEVSLDGRRVTFHDPAATVHGTPAQTPAPAAAPSVPAPPVTATPSGTPSAVPSGQEPATASFTATNRGVRAYAGLDTRLNLMDFPLGVSATGYQAGVQGTLEFPVTRTLDVYVNGGAGYLSANGEFTARNGQSATHHYSGGYGAFGAGAYFRPVPVVRLGLGLEFQYRGTSSSDATPSDHTSPTGMSVDDCVAAGLGQQQCAQAATGSTHTVESGRNGALVTNGGRLSARPGSSPMMGGALVASADVAVPFFPGYPLSLGLSASVGRYNVSPGDFGSYGVTEYGFGLHAAVPLQATETEAASRSPLVNLSTPVTLSGDTLTIPRSLIGREWPAGVASIWVDGESQSTIHIPTGNEDLQIPASALSTTAARHTIIFKDAEGHELLNIGFQVNDTRTHAPATPASAPTNGATPAPQVREEGGHVVVVGVGTLDNVETTMTRPEAAFNSTTGVVNTVRVANFIVPGDSNIPAATTMQVRFDGEDVGGPIEIPAQTADSNRAQTTVAITIPASRLTPQTAVGVLGDGDHNFQILLNINGHAVPLRHGVITITPPYASLSQGRIMDAPGRFPHVFVNHDFVIRFNADRADRENLTGNVRVMIGDYNQERPVRREADNVYTVSVPPETVLTANHDHSVATNRGTSRQRWNYTPENIRIQVPGAPESTVLTIRQTNPASIFRSRTRQRP